MWKFSYLIVFLNSLVVGHAERPSVIIIGAGASGIAAATKLLENSFNNITILEAEDRIGGRINTVKFGQNVVDLGDEYCTGTKGNIAYDLVKDYDVLEPAGLTLEDNIYYSDGTKLDLSLSHDLNDLIFEIYQKKYKGNVTEGKSTGDAFRERYNSVILPKYQNDKKKTKILEEGLRFSEGFVSLLDATPSWSEASANSDFETQNEDLVWKGVGYKTIIDILMKSYPDPKKKLDIDNKIHLNKKVQRIIWDTDETVTVVTADNSTYTADYVIFTPSAGVLKKDKDTLFDPKLPSLKEDAIINIGYGSVIKFVINFSTKWWHDDDKLFAFFWSHDDLNSINFSDGPSKDGVSWVAQILELITVPHNSNAWSGWISGDLLQEIEKLSDETMKMGIKYVVNKFLGKTYNVTEITEIVKSTWTINENFLGAISYVKRGTYKRGESIQGKLAEPVTNAAGKPKLLFAGEATHSTHYGLVHGAIETGHREAQRIIELYSKAEQ
ncbi:hypothetical protein MTP99_002063 [Tenebrio molitor]|nr:hypothetical protein MTP99_002063 [Tenebrio molitor]